jgi:hypothetical protein
MHSSTVSVGSAIAAALARGEAHRAASTRQLRVRVLTDFGDDADGLTIRARIAARNNQELAAQDGKGVRWIAWSELDGRAADLVDLVDDAVAEVEAAVKAAPDPTPLPSRSDDELNEGAFDALIEETYEAITKVSRALMGSANARELSASVRAEAVMCAALNLAALAAVGAAIETQDAAEALRGAVSEIRQKVQAGLPPLEKPPFDA